MDSETAINKDYINAKETCEYGYKGAHRLGTVRELLNVSLWIPENINKLTTPVLLFHGLCDKITTPAGSLKAFNCINTDDKEIVLLPNSEHKLLIENNPDDLTPHFVYSRILNWLESH
jgi:alpha-beta hydrolase superfamily lysophospholipase